jgi:hypothetical protein
MYKDKIRLRQINANDPCFFLAQLPSPAESSWLRCSHGHGRRHGCGFTSKPDFARHWRLLGRLGQALRYRFGRRNYGDRHQGDFGFGQHLRERFSLRGRFGLWRRFGFALLGQRFRFGGRLRFGSIPSRTFRRRDPLHIGAVRMLFHTEVFKQMIYNHIL